MNNVESMFLGNL